MTEISETHFVCPLCGDRRPKSSWKKHREAHRKLGHLKEDHERFEEDDSSDPYHYTPPYYDACQGGLMSGVGTKKRK